MKKFLLTISIMCIILVISMTMYICYYSMNIGYDIKYVVYLSTALGIFSCIISKMFLSIIRDIIKDSL